jgi:soluble lytic murein transglycosylase
MQPRLAVPPEPDWIGAGFAQSEVFEAALLFLAAGQAFRAEQFLSHLVEVMDPGEIPALAVAVRSLNDPHLEVAVGKAAAFEGVPLPEAYFPVGDLGVADLPVPKALALAIARRESEFDPVVVSPAGALGLMQLMPGTAQMMASKLGVAYSKSRLTTDPVYNATLGSAYLEGLIEEFGEAYPLVAAGYNAGPGRPRSWIGTYGDPRSDAVDAIDWIEHIPFTETRNYVMRVMEALTVYEARLAGEVQEIRLSERLKGR